MPNAPAPDQATEIRIAVESVRPQLPHLASDYADRAISAGKTVAAVKSDLLDQMMVSPRERSMASMKALVAGMKGEAATPDAKASRNSMIAQLKRQGIEPKGA